MPVIRIIADSSCDLRNTEYVKEFITERKDNAMKKLFALILAAALLLGLAGCGGGGDNKPPKDLEENPASDFTYKYNAGLGGIEITKYKEVPVKVRIPEKIEGEPVVGIGEGAFKNSGIMSVYLPNSVTSIGDRAFSGCSGLTSVTIPNNVTSIGDDAFQGCTGLTSVTIPNSVTSIGGEAFGGCTGLTNLNVEGPVKTGGYIWFGGIFWRVLEVQGGKALIISNDILERRQYNGKFEKITWENCDLRGYLNNEFYNTTFTAAERTRIATTQVKNDDNQWYGTAGGNDTTDKIFLLSLEEAVKYFGDSGQLANRPGDTWWIDDQYNSARIAYRKNGKAEWFAVWWWLRSPGFDSGSAAIVDGDGSVGVRGYNVHVGDYYVYNDYASGGVRPALWLDLK